MKKFRTLGSSVLFLGTGVLLLISADPNSSRTIRVLSEAEAKTVLGAEPDNCDTQLLEWKCDNWRNKCEENKKSVNDPPPPDCDLSVCLGCSDNALNYEFYDQTPYDRLKSNFTQGSCGMQWAIHPRCNRVTDGTFYWCQCTGGTPAILDQCTIQRNVSNPFWAICNEYTP
jgi:hypothetical protein